MLAKTKGMIEIANDINSLAVEYQTLISKMYAEIINLPTSGWAGQTADLYIRTILSDKSDLMLVGDGIKQFSNMIVNNVNIIDQGVSYIWKEGNNG